MFLAALFLDAAAASLSTSFDLRDLPAKKTGCSSQKGEAKGDIIVCARTGDPDKARLSGPYDERDGPPQAEFVLFGRVRARIHGDQANIGGFTTNRAMVTVTVPF